MTAFLTRLWRAWRAWLDVPWESDLECGDASISHLDRPEGWRDPVEYRAE